MGETLLQTAIKDFHNAMGLNRLSRVLSNMDALSRQRPLKIATVCSGSDIAMLAIGDMFRHYRDRHGIHVPAVDHVFSCESVKFKQQWVCRHFCPKLVFDNLLTLATGTSFDIVSNAQCRVPAADGILAGFECDSISGLNSNAGANRDVVATGDGKTGSTARATLQWIKDHRPFWVVLENVRSLNGKGSDGVSNLDTVKLFFKKHGYVCQALLLDAHPFGCPARRERYYIVAVRVSQEALSGDAVSPGWFADLASTVASMHIPTRELSEFLLPDGHPLLMQTTVSSKTVKGKTRKETKKEPDNLTVASWEQDHMEAFAECQLDWPPRTSDLHAYLPRRKQELVALYSHLCPPGQRRIDDINMSVFFGSPGTDLLPCIVSSCTMWLTDKGRGICRELHGAELMSIQGWAVSEQLLENPVHEELKDMAGNAFCAFTLVPVLIALFSLLDWTSLDRDFDGHDNPLSAPPVESECEEEGLETESSADPDVEVLYDSEHDDLDGLI